MKKFGLLSLVIVTSLSASGYKIPEKSQKSVALSGANVANANGADAAYDNPANMAFETGNGSFEVDLGYIHLTSVKFTGDVTAPSTVVDSSGATSVRENFLIPTFFYVSPKVDNFRFGLALVSPVGLTKRWDEQPGEAVASKFSLTTYEVNPTVAYKITDELAIGAGLRMIYSSGTAQSNAPATSALLIRDMNGDGLDFGYNIALTYKPLKELSLAATYRSNISLDLEGDASLSAIDGSSYSGPVSVSLPAPATLNLAAAYTFDNTTTVEFVYDKVYWSEYQTLDFDYQGDTTSMDLSAFLPVFDAPISKNWTDTNSYRLGATHKYNSDWTLMGGIVYFETPMPDETLNFEHPDSDGMAYSIGARYEMSETIEVGASFLYADREDRTVSNNNNGIDGTFSDTAVYYLSLGVEYKF